MNEFENISDLIDDDETYDIITMTDENGEDRQFFVVDGIEDGGITYLLVVDTEKYDDDEAEAYILKEVFESDSQSVYEFVSDDDEYSRIAVLLQDNETDYEMKF